MPASRGTIDPSSLPYGWVEISAAALQRLRHELEENGEGVVDEMGVLAIHAAYADYFFPGTSVLHTRPRYIFFIGWNLLWLASQKGVGPTTVARRKDDADRWMTEQLVLTDDRKQQSGLPPTFGIIGARLFRRDRERKPLPATRVDFIYWTALREWGFYRSSRGLDRTQLFQRWRASGVERLADADDQGVDDPTIREPLARLAIPALPKEWQRADEAALDFELTAAEASCLQERLAALADEGGHPRLLATAAELCGELAPDGDSSHPWHDPLLRRAAAATGQTDRLRRARQASQLVLYVRAVYAALVEWVVETGPEAPAEPDRHFRDRLVKHAAEAGRLEDARALPLAMLWNDAPRLPRKLRDCLAHVQLRLDRVAAGDDAERALVDESTYKVFAELEFDRKRGRARLPRTDTGAARRIGFGPDTVSVYDLDYRWPRVRLLLEDLHRGLQRS